MDIRGLTLTSLRRNIGVVFQEALLFNRSLADNLRVGKPDATEEEMRIAAEIQQALWPRATQSGPYFRAAAASLPCRSIGGDFFDYINLGERAFGFALGDVAGKGPPAALLSALLQGIFAAQAASTLGPAATMALVNSALVRRGIENRFVTIFYAVLGRDGRLTYCNAGHNPPLLVVLWEEQDGPLVTKPKETGFGSALIKRGIPAAGVEIEYRRHGLVCKIELPLRPAAEDLDGD